MPLFRIDGRPSEELRRMLNENEKSKVALLAPVPKIHLQSALGTLDKWGSVAFGSNKFEVFQKLDKECDGKTVDVYIYASHADGSFDPDVSWLARYIRSVEHCDPKLRPTSSINDTPFGVYWIVDQLRCDDRKKRLHVAELKGFRKNKPYSLKFVPEGPLLIDHP